MKRVAVGMISHETNVFSPVPTPLQAWKDRSLALGDEVMKSYEGTKTGVGGFLEVAAEHGWDVVPTVCATAMPSAPTSTETYSYLKENLIGPVEREQPDAVLLHLHGAMITEDLDDPEGDIVKTVKELNGGRPVLLVMDLHGNITRDMCEVCDGVFAYDTNPHVDAY